MARKKIITDWSQVPILFDIGCASIIFGVTNETIRNWIKFQNMPVSYFGGKSPRFEKAEIQQWIKFQQRSERSA